MKDELQKFMDDCLNRRDVIPLLLMAAGLAGLIALIQALKDNEKKSI